MFKKSLLGLTLVLSMLLMTANPTSAAEKERDGKLEVGKPAPAFELKGLDGETTYKLADYRGQFVVITFQSATCPWERAYQPALNAYATEYGKQTVEIDGKEKPKFVFLAINANFNEKPDQIKAMAEKEKMTYPILKDPGNKVADAYSALTTPHIYIVDPAGNLAYQGGIEKAPRSPSQATKSEEQYLKPVLNALGSGSEVPYTDTISIGCTIKREKKQAS
jgi:peroxiredoxin